MLLRSHFLWFCSLTLSDQCGQMANNGLNQVRDMNAFLCLSSRLRPEVPSRTNLLVVKINPAAVKKIYFFFKFIPNRIWTFQIQLTKTKERQILYWIKINNIKSVWHQDVTSPLNLQNFHPILWHMGTNHHSHSHLHLTTVNSAWMIQSEQLTKSSGSVTLSTETSFFLDSTTVIWLFVKVIQHIFLIVSHSSFL